MSRQRRATGQGTLEYVLILAVVILAIIAAANGPIRKAIDKMFNDSASVMESASERMGK